MHLRVAKLRGWGPVSVVNGRPAVSLPEDDVASFVNLPISRKLAVALAAVLAVIFVSSAIVYDRLRVIERAKDWRVHTTDVLDTLQDATDAMLDQEASMRGYLLTADKTFLDRYHKESDAFAAALWKLKEFTSDNPAQQGRLDELNARVTQWRSQIAEHQIALAANPDTREAVHAIGESMADRAAVDLIRAKLDEIEGVERDLLAKRSVIQDQAYTAAYTVAAAGGAVSLLVALLMGLLLTRTIARPITRLTKAVEVLAKGDTNIDVPGIGRADEIGALAAAARVFRDKIIERQRALAELAHVNRVATVGQLTASIAHEINQPLSAIAINADATQNFLCADPPNVEAGRQILAQMADDSKRAGDIVQRIRNLYKKGAVSKDRFEANQAILDVIAVIRSETLRHDIALRTHLADDLPLVEGERVQLQQVLMNLIMNAVEAMASHDCPVREIQVSTSADAEGGVRVAVQDSGPGIQPPTTDRIFEPFYTTKPDGMGMGLTICRSIIAAHGGKLWVTPNKPRGALFQFTLRRAPA
jgi:signal transduction histidine kinase